MNIRSNLRRIGFAAVAMLGLAIPAQAVPLSFSTGTGFLPGYRTIDGSDLNKMVSAVNALIAQALGQTPLAALFVTGHMGTGAVPPVLTACGTTPAVAGSDTAGEVTFGTGTPTGCVITFAAPYISAPFCQVEWQANLASMQYTTTATAITVVQTATSSNKINYQCTARSGG